MTKLMQPANRITNTTFDRALQRLIIEIQDGLRHGFFSFTVTCEIVGDERRSLTLHVGKSYRFVIPKEDCISATPPTTLDSCDGSDPHAT